MLAVKRDGKESVYTFGKSLMWLASSNSSSKLLEYRQRSSGTLGNEQWRLSTYSTWRLQPLNMGMQRNMLSGRRIVVVRPVIEKVAAATAA